MGFGHHGLGGCGCCSGCDSGYETSYEDDFSGSVDSGWTFGPAGASYIHEGEQFKPIYKTSFGRGNAGAIRDMAIETGSITHVENEVTIYRPFGVNDVSFQELVLVGTARSGFGASERLMLSAQGSRYYWSVFDAFNQPEKGGYVLQTPSSGDVLKITMDQRSTTISTGYITWDVEWLVNGSAIHTAEVIRIREQDGLARLVHCYLQHGLYTSHFLSSGFDENELTFDNYSMAMS